MILAQHHFVYYAKGYDIAPFIYYGGNFEYKTTPSGIRYRDQLRTSIRKSYFRDLGYETANAVVQSAIGQLHPSLDLNVGTTEMSAFIIRTLEELVRIGIRNYQDKAFLHHQVQRYIDQHPATSRQDIEQGFYQPFLRDVIQRDEFLAGKVTEGSALACGRTDIMICSKIPIEAKVIYPKDDRNESVLDEFGVGQSSQYASLSTIAFLAVLDLRERTSQVDLSNIKNDVRVITSSQASNNVSIIRVSHVCGYGRPSRVAMIS